MSERDVMRKAGRAYRQYQALIRELEAERDTLTQQVEKARRTLELVKADAVIGLGSEAPKMNLQKIRERVRATLDAMEGEER